MEKLKEIWNNRKTRGVIFIIFYVILFSYIFMVYGGRTKELVLPENKPIRNTKEEVINYEYSYISDDRSIDVKKYNEVVNFKIDDNDYYYINNKTYLLKDEKFHETENPLTYNFDYLNNIEKLKDASNQVKITKYADGTIEQNYNINKMQFMNIFGIKEENENSMINYSLFIKNEKLERIVLTDLNVEIKILNVEDVLEINTNYEFYEGEE